MATGSDTISARLDHVAIAVARVADTAPFMAGVLGARPHSGARSPGYVFCHWELAAGARLELLEPDGPADGFLHRFIDRHGPGIHHVTFKVPDLGLAARRVSAAGYDLVGFSDADPAWKEFFVHPKQAQGVVVQFAESHPERMAEPLWGPDAPSFGTLPAVMPPPVTVTGLVATTRDETACRRLWEEAALGEGRREGDRIVFRWPESPLAIAVVVDPDADRDGPDGIALRDGAGREIPDGPHPLLGTRFLTG